MKVAGQLAIANRDVKLSSAAWQALAASALLCSGAAFGQAPRVDVPGFTVPAARVYAPQDIGASSSSQGSGQLLPSARVVVQSGSGTSRRVYEISRPGVSPRLITPSPAVDGLNVTALTLVGGAEPTDGEPYVMGETTLQDAFGTSVVQAIVRVGFDGSVAIVQRSDDVAPGIASASFTLQSPRVASDGWISSNALAQGLGVTQGNGAARYRISPLGQATLVSRAGSAAIGFAEGFVQAPLRPQSLSSQSFVPGISYALKGGASLFEGLVIQASTGQRQSVWFYAPRDGEAAPLVQGDGTLVGAAFLGPVRGIAPISIREDGRMMMQAMVTGNGSPDVMVLLAGVPGAWREIARTGASVPGLAPAYAFSSFAVNGVTPAFSSAPVTSARRGAALGEVLFLASVSAPGVQALPVLMRHTLERGLEPVVLSGFTRMDGVVIGSVGGLVTSDAGVAIFTANFDDGSRWLMGWSADRGLQRVALLASSASGPSIGMDVLGASTALTGPPLRTVVATNDDRFMVTVNGTDYASRGGSAPGVYLVRPGDCFDTDFDNDGVRGSAQDRSAFAAVFAGNPCPTGSCDGIDFNNDGIFPSDEDLAGFLRALAVGGC